MAQAVSDFFQLPNVQAINTDAAGETISFRNFFTSQECQTPGNCGTTVYSADTFYLTASLDSVSGRPGRFMVPGPSTFALVPLALAVMAIARRRKS